MKQIQRLQLITDDPEKAALACRGGVRWVQFRLKKASPTHLREAAIQTQQVCRQYGARFIINDHVQLAKELEADGVHLGQQDLPPMEARRILGNQRIIGGTANTLAQIERLHEEGVDYIGLGPFRFTTTKEKLSPLLGISGYQHILSQCKAKGLHLPIVAIGGIQLADLSLLLQTGVHGIAVSGAICQQEDVTLAAQEWLTTLMAYPLIQAI